MENVKKHNTPPVQKIWEYHHGEMSDIERHELEKAALEDPFLDDALEGYQYDANAINNLEKLKAKINKRNKEKHNGFWYNIRPFYPHMAVAATLFVLAFSAYFILVRSIHDENLAKVETQSKKSDSQIQLSENTPLTAKQKDDPVKIPEKQIKKDNKVDNTITQVTSQEVDIAVDNNKNLYQSGNDAVVLNVQSQENEKLAEAKITSEDVTIVEEPMMKSQIESVSTAAKTVKAESLSENSNNQVKATVVATTKRKSAKSTLPNATYYSGNPSVLETYMKTYPFKCSDEFNIELHGSIVISYKTDVDGKPKKMKVENSTNKKCDAAALEYLKNIPGLERNNAARQKVSIEY